VTSYYIASEEVAKPRRPAGTLHAIPEGSYEPVCGTRATFSAFYDEPWDEAATGACHLCVAEVTRRGAR
jgi:hypothetical protein